MAALAKLIPNEKTLYYVMQCGNYRCHDGHPGGVLMRDAERALLQTEYPFIDCFPTFGGPCGLTLRQYGDIWEDANEEAPCADEDC